MWRIRGLLYTSLIWESVCVSEDLHLNWFSVLVWRCLHLLVNWGSLWGVKGWVICFSVNERLCWRLLGFVGFGHPNNGLIKPRSSKPGKTTPNNTTTARLKHHETNHVPPPPANQQFHWEKSPNVITRTQA